MFVRTWKVWKPHIALSHGVAVDCFRLLRVSFSFRVFGEIEKKPSGTPFHAPTRNFFKKYGWRQPVRIVAPCTNRLAIHSVSNYFLLPVV